jgi:hypothetical protein
MKTKWLILVSALAALLLLAACAASGGTEQPAAQPEGAGAPEEAEAPAEEASTEAEEPGAAEPTEPLITPTPEMSDVPIFEGAENYKSTGNGTYISYDVPDTTVDIVIKFYQEQLLALGWEQKSKTDTGFGQSITILRSKPDKNISVSIDTNVINNGVRVLITLIPK